MTLKDRREGIELVFDADRLHEYKLKVIEEYKKSEYPSRIHTTARRKGFIEACDGLKQWIINEAKLDPEPCCYRVRINNIIRRLDEWKKQGDKRFVLDKKHIRFIKERLHEGETKSSIAKELGVSISTIVYWTNPVFRMKQMEKNRKKRFGKTLKPIKSSPKEESGK